MAEEEIATLKKRLDTLQKGWADDKRSFQALLQETKKTLEEDKTLCLQRMKMQYLETLKKIRDEIRASKAKNAEAMEREWVKRKRELTAKLEAETDLK